MWGCTFRPKCEFYTLLAIMVPGLHDHRHHRSVWEDRLCLTMKQMDSFGQ